MSNTDAAVEKAKQAEKLLQEAEDLMDGKSDATANTAAAKRTADIILIVDRSGSMAAIAHEAESGLREFIRKQQAVDGDGRLTVCLFDDRIERPHERSDLAAVDADSLVLEPRGMTAMNDAIGTTLTRHGTTGADGTVVMIVTDGMENASQEFTTAQVRRLIDERKTLGWEFIFLGQNIDAAGEAGARGIEPAMAMRHRSDRMVDVCNLMARKVASHRACPTEAGLAFTDDEREALEDRGE